MKRKFETAESFSMELHQADVDDTRKNSESDLSDEAAAIRFLIALWWSKAVLKGIQWRLEKSVHDQVGLALHVWAEEHASIQERAEQTPSTESKQAPLDSPPGTEGRKRLFDVTLSDRIELDQKDLDDLKNEDPEEHTDDWVLRYSLARFWSEAILDSIEPRLDEVYGEIAHELVTWTQDHMSVDEVTENGLTHVLDPHFSWGRDR